MKTHNSKRQPKWWNNGWYGMAVLLAPFFVLFFSGKYSATYEPNPVIEGRLLSEWTDDLTTNGSGDKKHHHSVDVLRRHRSTVTSVLIEWLDERDTLPQLVYYSTMSIIEGKRYDLLDYRGSHSGQVQAAMAFRYMKDNCDDVDSALQRVISQYGDSRTYAAELAEKALGK